MPPRTTSRIALIIPADNVVMEPELYALNLDHVVFNSIRLTSINHEEMRAQSQSFATVANELGVDALVYACAETSFNAGSDTRQSMSDVIRSSTGLPFITATDATFEAIHDIGAKNITLFTPYADDSGALLESSFESRGMHVTHAKHYDFRQESDDPREWFNTNRVSPDRVIEMASELDVSGSDALVIASTNLATLPAIRTLENRLGVPVITTNQSIVWWALRTLQISATPAELGRLVTDTSIGAHS